MITLLNTLSNALSPITNNTSLPHQSRTSTHIDTLSPLWIYQINNRSCAPALLWLYTRTVSDDTFKKPWDGNIHPHTQHPINTPSTQPIKPLLYQPTFSTHFSMRYQLPSSSSSRKSDVRVHTRVRQYGRSLSGRREHLDEDVITYCCTGKSAS